MLSRSKSYKSLNWLGKQLSSENLHYKPQDAQLGQTHLVKCCLWIGILLIWGVATVVLGHSGAVFGLNLAIDHQGFSQIYAIAVLISGISLVISFSQGFSRSLLTSALIIFICFPVGIWLGSQLNVVSVNKGVTALVVTAFYLLLNLGAAALIVYAIALFRLMGDQPKRNLKLLLIFASIAGILVGHYCFQGGFLNNETIRLLQQQNNTSMLRVGDMAASLGAWIFSSLSAWFASRMTQGPRPWKLVNATQLLEITTWQGTSFQDLDLSHLNFSGCNLAHTNFRASCLYRTCLLGVKGLEYAQVDHRYLDLDQPKVQRLVTGSSDPKINFQGATLRGVYLQGQRLQGIDFTDANLDGADLQSADLQGAILIRAIVTDVDFSGANLTGCYIKDILLNSNTQFNGVICDYIYEDYLAGTLSKPLILQPGELEERLRKMRHSFELVFQEQVDPLALGLALEKFRLEDDGLGLELQSIQQQDDQWVIQVRHREGISQQQAKQELRDTYVELLKDDRQTLTEMVQQLIQVLPNLPGNVTMQGEVNRIYLANQAGNIMESQNINAGRDVDASSGSKISVGGDVTGSTLNLGTLSGHVTTLLQQMQDSQIKSTQDLADILAQLQTAIHNEATLSEEQKEDAMAALETLAEEGKKTPESRGKKLCSQAMTILKNIATSLSDVSKLADIFKTSFPMIKTLLGLP